MPAPKPLLICDDSHGVHVWEEPFHDGDTCACGAFYLDLHPDSGFAAEVRMPPKRTPGREED
jgi:hypothetical protein